MQHLYRNAEVFILLLFVCFQDILKYRPGEKVLDWKIGGLEFSSGSSSKLFLNMLNFLMGIKSLLIFMATMYIFLMLSLQRG